VLKQRKYVRATHSAVFCEVRVDEALGTVRVTRVVSAIAAGRIISAKTARSQVSAAWCGASARRCTRRRTPTTGWAAS
jgi:xanthine dehydrogenase YagR molybdenum-binding subunit